MKKKGFRKGILLLLLILAMPLWPGSRAKGDELAELKQQITEQNQKLQELMERLEQFEARQQQKEKVLTEKIEEVAQKKDSVTLPDSLKWVEKVKISGDFRYRHERIDEEKTGSGVRWKDGRDRDRIRARLMIEAMVNDDWGLGFRLASGSADPVSTNQTLEDSFSSKTLWLDLAYFNWHPQSLKGTNVFGGKIKNPFYKVGGNQLIWDSDLNPEGIAAQFTIPFASKTELHINGGGFWVDESSSGVDTSLWGLQGYVKQPIGKSDFVLGGVSYFDYGNIQGRGDLQSTWSSSSNFFGNTISSSKFASDYDILEAFAEYGTQLIGKPFTVYGDWAKNLVASSGEDSAWLIGGKFNKAKEPGTWEAGYSYREMDADSILGAFTDSDFIGGGTDGRGHEFGFTYQLAKNLQACVTYFFSEIDRTSGRSLDYRRLQLDLNLKF